MGRVELKLNSNLELNGGFSAKLWHGTNLIRSHAKTQSGHIISVFFRFDII